MYNKVKGIIVDVVTYFIFADIHLTCIVSAFVTLSFPARENLQKSLDFLRI